MLTISAINFHSSANSKKHDINHEIYGSTFNNMTFAYVNFANF